MQSIRCHAPILWCILIALPAQAASIKEAFELASQIDAPVQAAQQVQAQNRLHNAQSLTPEPLSLTISGTNSLNDNLSPSAGAREYEVEVGIPLWQWGQQARLLTQLTQSAKAEQSQFMLSRWELAGALREAVWAARLAQVAQQSAAQQRQALEKIAHDVAQQLKAGEVAPLEVNLANQAVLEAQWQLEQRQQQFNDSVLQFQAIAGDAALPDQAEIVPTQWDVIHPLRQAMQEHAELARAQLAQAQYDTQDTPELMLALTRERGVSDERYKHLGKISLRIPFGSDARTQLRVSGANAELMSMQTRLQRTERQVNSQQDAAKQARVLASRQVDITQQNLRLATQAWDWQQRRYQAGQSSLQVYLNAQRDFFDRGLAVQQAELELGRANSRLLQTIGVLP